MDNTQLQLHNGVSVEIPQLSNALLEAARQMQYAAQRALEAFNDSIKRIVEAAQRQVQLFAETMRSVLSVWAHWRPLIYVSPPAEINIYGYLSAVTNQHGFFVFGGRTIFRLHSRGSRVGRFLNRLLLSMSEVVTYEELKAAMGAGDTNKTFKDLKYKLKQEGYKLDYTLVRTEGIALNGIIRLA